MPQEASRPEIRTMRVPEKLHHLGYVTKDAEATVEFYSGILGLELIRTVIDDHVPSTGDPFPYIHLFFKLGDGSNLAFFECIDLPDPLGNSHAAYGIFNHLALDVGSVDEVDRWAGRLRQAGVPITGPYDHGAIYSVYFYDPNGIRLELTANLAWQEDGAKATRQVAEWAAQKAEATKLGHSGPLLAWIEKNRKPTVA